MKFRSSPIVKYAIFLLAIMIPLRLGAETWLVEGGQPRAEIVIAEDPDRSTRIAADELQSGIKKISGARLPIVYAPTSSVPVQVYVGRSSGTDRLGIDAEGLEAGAYRIVSGENWLVLIGDDTDFTPIEPWPKSSGGITLPAFTEPWDKATGGHFGSPLGQMRKHRLSLPGDLGLPEGEGNPNERFELWGFDERGSFNAVCDFLRKLGMRWYLPAFTARVIGETVNATKGISQGEDIWINFSRDFHKDPSLGFNHFGVYFTARMYWGGAEADVDALLAEYCERFYGPAGDRMRAFFDYCEKYWRFMSKERDKIAAALSLFAKAQAAASPDSVYARRLALIDTFLDQLRLRAHQLGKVRGPVPMLRIYRSPQPGEIVIDGKLDDKYWNRAPVASGRLRETETGGAPALATTFKSAYSRDLNSAIFAIRCEVRPGEPLNIATTGRDDPAIFKGDTVELLIETESHSYYQIAVNPAGAVFDADCAGATKSLDWDARAEVATHVADDHWTVEIRIPVTSDDNDPLHLVVGRGRPKSTMPWFFNLRRHRVRDNGAELSAFSPTATGSLHEESKCAHDFKGDHDLRSGEPEPDYLRLRSQARQLFKSDREGAVAAFEELAGSEDLTERQRCDALSLAAFYARRFRDFDWAERLAAAAPIEAVAKTIRMQNLIEQRQFEEVIERFGEEDLTRWPFWAAAVGYFVRGRARAELGDEAKADADLQMALSLTTDKFLRREILEVQDQPAEASESDLDRN